MYIYVLIGNTLFQTLTIMTNRTNKAFYGTSIAVDIHSNIVSKHIRAEPNKDTKELYTSNNTIKKKHL